MSSTKAIFLFAVLGTLFAPIRSFGQSKADSTLRMVELLPATVSSIQSPDRAPYATQKMNASELAKRDGSMDLPFLLRFTPSLVVTSDAGAGVGFMSWSYRGTSTDPDFNADVYNNYASVPLAYQVFAGARYYFTDNFGAYAEAGAGITLLNFGVNLKF